MSTHSAPTNTKINASFNNLCEELRTGSSNGFLWTQLRNFEIHEARNFFARNV